MLTGADRLAGARPSDRGRRLGALVRWTTAFITELRWHQAEEDGHAFPALVERIPAAASMVARLAVDHRELTALQDQLAPAMAALADPKAAFGEARQRAADTAGRLHDLLAAHVFDEDVNMTPLIERHVSFDEHIAHQRAAARRLPRRDGAFSVLWLLAGCSPDEREQVFGFLPARLEIAGRAGSLRYRRLVRAAFGDG